MCILFKGELLIFIKCKYFIMQKKIKSVCKAQMASIFTRASDGNIICERILKQKGLHRQNNAIFIMHHFILPYFLHGAVLLEKLTGCWLVKKYPAIYRTRRFITAFSNAHHQLLS
jgi:hypothetical protein